jgi:hypothetical protein
MTLRTRAWLLALLHVAIVGVLGLKLQIDRATLPRVWARAAPVDPSLPIRGRYVRLRIEADPAGEVPPDTPSLPVRLTANQGRLEAIPGAGTSTAQVSIRDGRTTLVPYQTLAYFIPDGFPDPSIRAADEELWVEVTVPPRGLPRPIRLGVKRNGVLTPLQIP